MLFLIIAFYSFHPSQALRQNQEPTPELPILFKRNQIISSDINTLIKPQYNQRVDTTDKLKSTTSIDLSSQIPSTTKYHLKEQEKIFRVNCYQFDVDLSKWGKDLAAPQIWSPSAGLEQV